MTPSPLPDNPTPPMPIQPDVSGYVPNSSGYLGSGNTGNPVLDEISAAHASLSPQAQQAIEGAHGILGISSAHSDPALSVSATSGSSGDVVSPSAITMRRPGPMAQAVPIPNAPLVADPMSQATPIPNSPAEINPMKRAVPLVESASPELAVPGVSGPRGPLPILSPEVPAPARPMAGATGGTPMADSSDDIAEAALGDSTATANADRASYPSSGAPSAPPMPIQPALPGESELARLRASGAGLNAIHDPFVRGLAKTGDILGSTFAKGLSSNIPGSTAHNIKLQGRAEKEATDEEAERKNAADVAKTETETGLLPGQHAAQEAAQNAEAQNYLSEAEARKNPDLQVVAHPVIDPNDESKTPRTGYFNKKTGAMTYGPEIAAAPVAESNKPSIEKMDNGDVVAVHYDPATKKSSMEVVYHGDPKVETDIAKLEVNGRPHSVVVNKKTGETIKDLGETGEKPPTVNVNQGTWSIEEDADGKPIEYNSKTGETRAVAPGGVQKPGTKAKGDVAKQPAKDALNYAENYLQAPEHTGTGDEALQEKFFELAKPTTGFRMTQPQMDMLKNSRSWMGSVAAHLRHATTGTWFSDDQRAQIVQTMRDLAKAKGIDLTGTAQPGAANGGSGTQLPGGISLKDIDAEIARRKGKQ